MRKAALEEYFGEIGNHTRFVRVHMDSCDFSLEEYAVEPDRGSGLYDIFQSNGIRSISFRC